MQKGTASADDGAPAKHETPAPPPSAVAGDALYVRGGSIVTSRRVERLRRTRTQSFARYNLKMSSPVTHSHDHGHAQVGLATLDLDPQHLEAFHQPDSIAVEHVATRNDPHLLLLRMKR